MLFGMAINKFQHPSKYPTYPTTPLNTKLNNRTNKTDNDSPFLRIHIMIEKHSDKKQSTPLQNKLSHEKKIKNIKIKHKINTVRIMNRISISGIIIGIANLWTGAIFIGPQQLAGRVIAYSGMIIFGLSAITGMITDRMKNHITKRKNKDNTSKLH